MATVKTPRGVEKPSTTDFGECRTFNHAWDQFYPTGWQAPVPGCFRVSLRCTRCGTERHDTVRIASGSLDGRSYDWPEGYLMEKGVDRPTRDELRVDMFARLRTQLARHNAIGVNGDVVSITTRKVS